VAHDLAVVKHVSDRVAVMYVGQLVEVADTTSLFAAPKHPYTEALLSAVPKVDPRLRAKRIVLEGEVADPAPSAGRLLLPPNRRWWGRHDEQWLGIRLLHPDVGRRQHTEPAARHVRRRQRMGGAVVGPHMAIDVEEPNGVRLVADSPPGQPLTERRGLPPDRQLPELAQGLGLGRAVEAEQDPQLARGLALQLLAVRMRSNAMKVRQRSVACGPSKPYFQGAVDLLPRVQQPEREHGRQSQQHAARAHRAPRRRPAGRFRQLAKPRGQRRWGRTLGRKTDGCIGPEGQKWLALSGHHASRAEAKAW
jgi:Oligopeptide/dipeptide transporter, C-terminal region